MSPRMLSQTFSVHRGALAALLLAAAALLAGRPVHAAQTALANQAIFSAVSVPGNVALTLSVEYPTATSIGNGIINYSSSTTYLGIFDPTRCYYYNIQTTKTSAPYMGSYFQPNVTASTTDHSCANSTTRSLWSGNFLNWASMSTIDPFRWALTGGYRSVDTTSLTILEKAWAPPAQASATESPPQITSQTTYPNLTPFSWSSIVTNIYRTGQYMCFTGNTNNIVGGATNPTGQLGPSAASAASYTISSTKWSGTLNNATEYTSGSTVSANNVYCVEVRVKVCDATAATGVEGNCTLYSSGYYKPEGLIQQYSQQMRFATFGYLLDFASQVRDGGVMRSRMNFVGPTAPVPGSAPITNPNAEWNATTGVFNANPDPTDVTNTLSASGCTGCNVPNSGSINYINMFGEHARSRGDTTGYKSGDNVSELYYTAIRYFKELGDVSQYSSLTLAGSDCVTNSADRCVDGFPVIQGPTNSSGASNWYPTDTSAPRGADYPIQYYCQKNFIIGIGDENTHQDGNLPGSALLGDGYEPAQEAAVAADTTVNVSTVTNWIGTQEGTVNGYSVSTQGSLGSTQWPTYGGCCGGATFYIAGLAYDAHVNDMLPNVFRNPDGSKTAPISTLSTFFVDVLEYGQFRNNNQYWLTTKYGGFTVPSGYTALTTPTVAGVAWPSSIWAANARTVANGTTNYTVPDNYYSGRDAAAMVSGLQSSFAQIAASISQTSTALSLTTPRVSPLGAYSYTTSFKSTDWTGSAVATAVSFDPSGNVVFTPTAWNAQTALDSQAAVTGGVNGWDTGRYIATCCSSTGAAVPFRQTQLGTTYLANLGGTATLQANVINYLRGDRSNEGAAGAGLFRVRDNQLGDIIDAQAVPVGPPSEPLASLYNPGYSQFQSTYSKRKTVVYVGSNDGMLHAFDGTVGASGNGAKELFAYVPSAVYAGPGGGPGTAATPLVNGIVSRTAQTFTHYDFVDATPITADVDLNNAGGRTSSTADWHTILVGGLGKGGAQYYALDITDPTTWTGESAVASKVLWEFTDSRLGFSYGPAVITKTAQYGWVVILTSGYNNADGKGYFFFLDPKNGSLLQVVSTGAGTATAPSGLAPASAYVADYSVGLADALYGADLLGSIWRVDLTPTTGAYSAIKFAQATDKATGAVQPITTRPLIEQAGTNSAYRYVVFGTGKTLDASDLTNSQINTIYSIYDGRTTSGGFLKTAPAGYTFPVTRSELVEDTNINNGTGNGSPPVKLGWFIDLTVNSIPGLTAPSTGYAYQVDTQSTANSGLAAFGINVASGLACSPAGQGALLAFDIAGGKSILDTSYNGAYMMAARIADVQFFNNNGSSVGLIVGDQSTNAPKQPNCPGCVPASTIKTLNWREIKGTN